MKAFGGVSEIPMCADRQKMRNSPLTTTFDRERVLRADLFLKIFYTLHRYTSTYTHLPLHLSHLTNTHTHTHTTHKFSRSTSAEFDCLLFHLSTERLLISSVTTSVRCQK
ncbi:Hypothetical predicted protein [Xyrichtys novacula]|uniref:Uncharacterized protein n=1 Tax=Xyrichtys novacula TaxID=13765 RepID=A0AAV1FG91_XYRNO|nr:Hypothetical predicted protein [Xyrichtys novacula]